jgi:hypothetical protein
MELRQAFFVIAHSGLGIDLKLEKPTANNSTTTGSKLEVCLRVNFPSAV